MRDDALDKTIGVNDSNRPNDTDQSAFLECRENKQGRKHHDNNP